MKTVSKQLMAFYTFQVALALVIIVLFETDVLPVGVKAHDKQSDFVMAAVMEIVSLGAAFLGLRLFKFRPVHDDLVARREPAMWKWGMARIIIIGFPMLLLMGYVAKSITWSWLCMGIMVLLLIFMLCLMFRFKLKGLLQKKKEG